MRWRPAVVGLLAVGLLGTAACTGTRDGTRPTAAWAGPATTAAPSTTGSAGAPGGTSSPATPDAPVPAVLAFDATTLDGKPFKGASLAGRPVVLWFWAPWCATCFGQAPTVADVAQQYGNRVSIVGVAGLGETKAMEEFVRDGEVGAVTHLNDQAGSVWRRFKIAEQSTFVLLDPSGKVLHRGWLDSVDFTKRVAALAA